MIKDRDTTVGYHCPFCGLSILNNINIFTMNGNLVKMKCVCGASELVVYAMKDHKYRITVPCILCPNSHSFTLSSTAFFQKDLFPFSCKFTAINICFIGKYGKVHEAMKKNEEELMQTFAAYEEEYRSGNPDETDGNLLFEDDDYFEIGENSLYDYFNSLDDDDDFDEDDDGLDYLDDILNTNKEPEFVLYRNKNYNPDSENSENVEDSDDNEYAEPDGNDTSDSGVIEANNIKFRSYQIVSQILDTILNLYTKKRIFCKCGNFDGKIIILDGAVRIGCKNCDSERDIKSTGASDAEYLNGIDALYLDFDD